LTTRGHAWNINIRPRSRIINRGRGVDIVYAASLAASSNISILMSRNWRALMGSQCRSSDARGCNCSAKNQHRDICHDFLQHRRLIRKFHHACLSIMQSRGYGHWGFHNSVILGAVHETFRIHTRGLRGYRQHRKPRESANYPWCIYKPGDKSPSAGMQHWSNAWLTDSVKAGPCSPSPYPSSRSPPSTRLPRR